MTKPRHPLIALFLLAAAVFLALGDQSGTLGRHVAHAADHYIGQLGTGLVVFLMICLGYFLGAPAGTATKLVQRLRARRRAAPLARIVVVEPQAPELPALSVVERRKADDVRSAMKGLGYLKHEYEPVVAGLDLSLPVEKLVRSSIQKLHAQKALS